MDEDTRQIIAVITAITICIVIFMFTVGILFGEKQTQDDNYCRTVPIERMDKKRCGVE